MSWEDLEPTGRDPRPVTQQQEDTDRLFLKVLGTEDGKRLMEVLRQWYVEPPVASPGAPADFAFYREGSRFVVLDIEARIRRALHG